MSDFTIDQGRLVDVVFGDYAGRAGLSEDGNEVAFAADLARLRRVKSGTVAGDVREVLSAEKSAVKGMIVLRLRPLAVAA